MQYVLQAAILLLCIVMVIYAVLTWLSKRANAYLAIAEYWVYLPSEKLPVQDDIMNLVLTGSAVGPREGLLFSDIRLHIALVLRSKNAYLFRPDLFDTHIEPTAEILTALAGSMSLAKIRFASQTPPKDDRYLQLLPYLAYAYAKLGDSVVVYDVHQELLMTRSDLQALLKKDANAARPDMHLQVVWHTTERGGRAETRGLIKRGLPELATEDMEADERVLVTSVLDDAARQLWQDGALAPSLEVDVFADKFRLDIARPKRGLSQVRIMRVMAT